MPLINPQSRTSNLWRAIVEAWPLVNSNIIWCIKNGNDVCFWKDRWILETPALINLNLTNLPHSQINFSVSFDLSSAGWRWSVLNHHVRESICDKIATISPAQSAQPDFPSWVASSDGSFFLKSAFSLIFSNASVSLSNSGILKLVWRWKGPARIRSLLWKIAHGRLLTNEERVRRHMTQDDACQHCPAGPKSLMHVIRDCEEVQCS